MDIRLSVESVGLTWDNYYSFAFVRNPWDRFVSVSLNLLGMSINEAITQRSQHWAMRPQVDYVNGLDGRQTVTFIGRFENLYRDWSTVCDGLGIVDDLPHLNKSQSPDYRSYYTDRTRDIVAQWYIKDIEMFGYQF